MIHQLCDMTKEAFPLLETKCLEHVSIPASVIMVGICLYLTIKDGLVGDNFTPAFTAIGLVLLAVILSPAVYYYLRFNEEGENDDPYQVDLKATNSLMLRLAEDTHYAHVMRELEDHRSDKESPPY